MHNYPKPNYEHSKKLARICMLYSVLIHTFGLFKQKIDMSSCLLNQELRIVQIFLIHIGTKCITKFAYNNKIELQFLTQMLMLQKELINLRFEKPFCTGTV